MGQRAAPAPFLVKTYQLVDDRATDDVVSWNESGTTFVVWKMADFARDLLPNYFKHNNFSSFVRQLNTYGFRKIVPDKWEFANDNFKRGEKELLSQIRRRKTTVPSLQAEKSATVACDQPSPSNSGEDLGSTSTTSPDSKRGGCGSTEAPARVPFADLSDENEKLKRDNKMLVTELSQTKKQCDELMTLLKEYMDGGRDKTGRGTMQVSCGSIDDGSSCKVEVSNNDENGNGSKGDDGLKLFGVWVKGNGKKRCQDENFGSMGVQRKEMKTSETDTPWMKITSLRGETSKVCN